jgi:hypothetical protein
VVCVSPVIRDDLQIGECHQHARLPTAVLMRELGGKVGCTESPISNIDNGRVVPSRSMLQQLVQAPGRD